MIRTLVATAILSVALAGCSVLNANETKAVQQFLADTTATQTAGLLRAKNDFLAATPPQNDGASCVGNLPDPTKSGDLGSGVLSVLAAIQREINANGVPSGANPTTSFEALAKLSIYQPSSAQFNWAVTQVETGCIAFIHDINQSINSTAGIFTALPSMLALTAAPVGL